MLAPVVALLSSSVVLAAAFLLWRDARAERAGGRDELQRLHTAIAGEREAMREERRSWEGERMQLVNRLMFATGKPYEEPPIWQRSSAPGRDDELLPAGVVFPEDMIGSLDPPPPTETVDYVGGTDSVWASR